MIYIYTIEDTGQVRVQVSKDFTSLDEACEFAKQWEADDDVGTTNNGQDDNGEHQEGERDPSLDSRVSKRTGIRKSRGSTSSDDGMGRANRRRTRRQRGSSVSDDATGSQELQDGEDTKQTRKTTRKSRRKSDTGTDEPQTKRRRGRPRKDKATTNDEITDADLAKACSTAAAIIGPNAVKEIIEEYGVESVDELEEKQRSAFLRELEKESA